MIVRYLLYELFYSRDCPILNYLRSGKGSELSHLKFCVTMTHRHNLSLSILVKTVTERTSVTDAFNFQFLIKFSSNFQNCYRSVTDSSVMEFGNRYNFYF